MKKVETHLHTSPVSCCSRLTAEAAAEEAAEDVVEIEVHPAAEARKAAARAEIIKCA